MASPAQIEVRKGVPLPEPGRAKTGPRGGNLVYPWMRMSIGDHFLFPAGKDIRAATSKAAYANTVTGAYFVCRTLRDGPDAGRIGCWRVA